jgi:hypothetical protein
MTLAKEFLDKNAELIKEKFNDNNAVGLALIECLAAIDYFEKENNLEYTDDEKNKLLNQVSDVQKQQQQAKSTVEAEKVLKETQDIVNQQNAIPRIEVLALLSCGYKGEVSSTVMGVNNWKLLFDTLKSSEYNNNPKTLSSFGSYDKVYFHGTWGAAAPFDVQREERLDISKEVGDFNPFTSENIYLDSLIDYFGYYWAKFICGVGDYSFTKGVNDLNWTQRLVVNAFFISKVEWNFNKKELGNQIISRCKKSLGYISLEDINQYRNWLKLPPLNKIPVLDDVEIINSLRPFFEPNWMNYIFSDVDTEIIYVNKLFTNQSPQSADDYIYLYAKNLPILDTKTAESFAPKPTTAPQAPVMPSVTPSATTSAINATIVPTPEKDNVPTLNEEEELEKIKNMLSEDELARLEELEKGEVEDFEDIDIEDIDVDDIDIDDLDLDDLDETND